LATVLSVARQCLETADVERRIAEMEAAITEGEDNVIPFKSRAAS
jgi:hypothetical protein